MSIAALVETLLKNNVDHAAIVEAVAAMEASQQQVLTPRQQRNARYYEARKERLNSDALRRFKTDLRRFKTLSDVLDENSPPLVDKESPHTPKENSYPPPIPSKKNPPKGGQKEKPLSPENELIALGVDPDALDDWKRVRVAKRAGSITKTVVERMKRESAKANITIADAVRTCAERGWQGFDAEWVNKPDNRAPPRPERQESQWTTQAKKIAQKWINEDESQQHSIEQNTFTCLPFLNSTDAKEVRDDTARIGSPNRGDDLGFI
jgi:hypothetical protein